VSVKVHQSVHQEYVSQDLVMRECHRQQNTEGDDEEGMHHWQIEEMTDIKNSYQCQNKISLENIPDDPIISTKTSLRQISKGRGQDPRCTTATISTENQV